MRNWFILLAWLVISCNEIEDCDISSSQDYAVIQFWRADTIVKSPRQVGFNLMYEANQEFYLSVVNDTFRITYEPFPGPADTFSNDTTVTALILPLNPAETSVSYVFETDSIDFQLTMNYRKNIEIFYHECSPTFNYELDTAYSSNLDSIVVVGKPIDSQIPVNVEIYL